MEAKVFSELKLLIEELSHSQIGEAYIKSGSASLMMKFSNTDNNSDAWCQDAVASPAPVATDTKIISSPGMGYFRLHHPFDMNPEKPTDVMTGQVVGYLQFEELLTEVVASKAGILSEPLVKDNTIVGYGDALFKVF